MKTARLLYKLHKAGMSLEQIQKEYGISKKYIVNKIHYYMEAKGKL